MTPKKESREADTPRLNENYSNISNHSDLIALELHRKASLNGQSMAKLYKTNVGSLDAFYRLFGMVEILYPMPLRQAFLDGFFEAVEQVQEGGNCGSE